jgi:hypothetical protein
LTTLNFAMALKILLNAETRKDGSPLARAMKA